MWQITLEMWQIKSRAHACSSFSTRHPSTSAVENRIASLPLPPSRNMWQQDPLRKTSSGTVGFSQTYVTSQVKQCTSSPTIKAPFDLFTILNFTIVQSTSTWYIISYASTNIWMRSTSSMLIPPHNSLICSLKLCHLIVFICFATPLVCCQCQASSLPTKQKFFRYYSPLVLEGSGLTEDVEKQTSNSDKLAHTRALPAHAIPASNQFTNTPHNCKQVVSAFKVMLFVREKCNC